MNTKNATLIAKDIVGVFELWLELTRAMHKLTNTEIQVLSVFLAKRHELKTKINDDELLNEYLFSTKIKKEVEGILKFAKDNTLSNTINILRKKGVIVKNQIQSSYIPNLSSDFKEFNISFKIILDAKR